VVSQVFYLLSTLIPALLAFTDWVLWLRRSSRACRLSKKSIAATLVSDVGSDEPHQERVSVASDTSPLSCHNHAGTPRWLPAAWYISTIRWLGNLLAQENKLTQVVPDNG
jgi:hypothetical protein